MLENSIQNLIKVKSDQKRLDNFSRERYNEEYPRDYSKPIQGYHY